MKCPPRRRVSKTRTRLADDEEAARRALEGFRGNQVGGRGACGGASFVSIPTIEAPGIFALDARRPGHPLRSGARKRRHWLTIYIYRSPKEDRRVVAQGPMSSSKRL